MPLSFQLDLPKTQNAAEFENMCRDVLNIWYGEKIENPFALYGRLGQNQQGIDILCLGKEHSYSSSKDMYIVAQCKNYRNSDEARFIDVITKDVKSVHDSFTTSVSKMYIMTAMDRSVTIQKVIADLNSKYEFEIIIKFWDDISEVIVQNGHLMKKYYEALMYNDYDMNENQLSSVFPYSVEEKSIVDRILSCIFFNLGIYNQALQRFLKTLEELQKYTKGQSAEQIFHTFDEYSDQNLDYIKKLIPKIKQIDEMDMTLLSDAGKIVGNRMNLGEIRSSSDFLTLHMESMCDQLSFLRSLYITNGRKCTDIYLVLYLDNYAKIAQLDCDGVFLCVNEMFLSVDSSEVLSAIKRDYLATLTPLCSRQNWKNNLDDIRMQLDIIFHTQQELLEDVEKLNQKFTSQLYDIRTSLFEDDILTAKSNTTEWTDLGTEELLMNIDREIRYWETRRKLDAFMKNNIQEANTMYSGIISYLTEKRISIQQKYLVILECETALSQMKEQLEALRKEACVKFKPESTDDLLTLWGKGRRFIKLKIYDMAAECFNLYMQASKDENVEKFVQKAVFFCNRASLTDIISGVLVTGFEENKPQQPVEIGDIIYAVNNQIINTVEELEAQKIADQIILHVLRFSENGETYDILEIPYDKNKGKMYLWALSE